MEIKSGKKFTLEKKVIYKVVAFELSECLFPVSLQKNLCN